MFSPSPEPEKKRKAKPKPKPKQNSTNNANDAKKGSKTKVTNAVPVVPRSRVGKTSTTNAKDSEQGEAASSTVNSQSTGGDDPNSNKGTENVEQKTAGNDSAKSTSAAQPQDVKAKEAKSARNTRKGQDKATQPASIEFGKEGQGKIFDRSSSTTPHVKAASDDQLTAQSATQEASSQHQPGKSGPASKVKDSVFKAKKTRPRRNEAQKVSQKDSADKIQPGLGERRKGDLGSTTSSHWGRRRRAQDKTYQPSDEQDNAEDGTTGTEEKVHKTHPKQKKQRKSHDTTYKPKAQDDEWHDISPTSETYGAVHPIQDSKSANPDLRRPKKSKMHVPDLYENTLKPPANRGIAQDPVQITTYATEKDPEGYWDFEHRRQLPASRRRRPTAKKAVDNEAPEDETEVVLKAHHSERDQPDADPSEARDTLVHSKITHTAFYEIVKVERDQRHRNTITRRGSASPLSPSKLSAKQVLYRRRRRTDNLSARRSSTTHPAVERLPSLLPSPDGPSAPSPVSSDDDTPRLSAEQWADKLIYRQTPPPDPIGSQPPSPGWIRHMSSFMAGAKKLREEIKAKYGNLDAIREDSWVKGNISRLDRGNDGGSIRTKGGDPDAKREHSGAQSSRSPQGDIESAHHGNDDERTFRDRKRKSPSPAAADDGTVTEPEASPSKRARVSPKAATSSPEPRKARSERDSGGIIRARSAGA